MWLDFTAWWYRFFRSDQVPDGARFEPYASAFDLSILKLKLITEPKSFIQKSKISSGSLRFQMYVLALHEVNQFHCDALTIQT